MARLPERGVAAPALLAKHHAQPPAAQSQNAAGDTAVKKAVVPALRCMNILTQSRFLTNLARDHAPPPFFHKNSCIGQQTRGIRAGDGRAHQQRRAVRKGGRHFVQGREAAGGKIFGAEIVSRGCAAEGQFGRHAEFGPGPCGLCRSVENAFQVSGNVAGDAVALDKSDLHAMLFFLLALDHQDKT